VITPIAFRQVGYDLHSASSDDGYHVGTIRKVNDQYQWEVRSEPFALRGISATGTTNSLEAARKLVEGIAKLVEDQMYED